MSGPSLVRPPSSLPKFPRKDATIIGRASGRWDIPPRVGQPSETTPAGVRAVVVATAATVVVVVLAAVVVVAR